MTMPTIERCTHHPIKDHGHCTRCGVAVFLSYYDTEYEDHTCPPGFTTPLTKSMMATTPVQRVRAFLDRRAQMRGLDQTEIAGLDGGINVAGGTSLLVADLRALVEEDLKVEIDETRACFGCGKDLTEEMAVTIFIREGQNFKPLPDNEVACINCGGNGQNVLTREEYFRITGTEPWSSD